LFYGYAGVIATGVPNFDEQNKTGTKTFIALHEWRFFGYFFSQIRFREAASSDFIAIVQ